MISSSLGSLKLKLRFFSIGKSILKSWFVPAGDKRIYIEISDLYPNRYLYNFLKFFILCGYIVYIPFNLKLLKKLKISKGESLFSSWILEEKIKIGRPKSPYETITAERLSNDYFSRNYAEGNYHVPMSEFPAFYFENIDLPIEMKETKRKNSIFMAGNLDAQHYDKITFSPFFSLPSRYRTIQHIKTNSQLYYPIGTEGQLEEFISSELDKKIIIIDTVSEFHIPIKKLKDFLVNFRFYLALPGVSMPQCHNVVEAMSVGCIPIIHEIYATTFHPPLKHRETALIYRDLENLTEVTSQALNLSAEHLKEMRENVFRYYSRYLSPQSIVKTIIEKRPKKILIQAEIKSLSLLKKD